MKGRILSQTAPALNEHGVSYRELLEREKQRNARIEATMRAALNEWMKADGESPNSRRRRVLMERARNLTERALN